MRRKVYLLLAALMTVGMLSACSENSKKEENKKDSTKANDMVEISQKENIVKAAGSQTESTIQNHQSESGTGETSKENNGKETEEAAYNKDYNQNTYAEISFIEAVMLEGELYYSTGKESDIKGRCGMMDGSIDSTVNPGEIPMKDNQSNFGKGYEFQWVGDDSVDVFMNDSWIRFKKQTRKSSNNKQDESKSKPTNVSAWDKSTLTKASELKPHGIGLKIKDRTKNYITAVLTNTTKKDIYYGEYFKVQVKLDGEWYDIPVDIGFHDLAHELPVGAKAEETYELTAYGALPAGTYRLVVEEAYDEFQIKER